MNFDRGNIATNMHRFAVAITYKGGLEALMQGLTYFVLAKIGITVLAPFNYIWENKDGLEIGGPSHIFESDGLLPVYKGARAITFIDYSNITLWKETRDIILEKVQNKLDCRFLISDATEIEGIPDNSFDFVLASHVLEHLANPLKAINRWRRLLKNGGFMVIVVPDKRFTFDHKRNVTTINHILEDYENNVNENDTTHLYEVINLHDEKMDNTGEDRAHFVNRILNNNENRTVHHHVFIPENVRQLMEESRMKVLYVRNFLPFHIIAICKKEAG
jgi:predicted SAM-dependent methyltransferase